MPTFIYKAKKGLQETVEGAIDADSKEIAVARLSDSGLTPISVVLAPAGSRSVTAPGTSAAKSVSIAAVSLRAKKIGLKELNIFTQQLRTLLKSRVELLTALNILYKQSDKPALKFIILDLYNTVKDGKTFSDGLAKYPNFFPVLYTNIIRAGEASGRLDESLTQLNEFLLKEQDLRMKVSTALAYPSMMVLVGIGTIFVLFSFVIPRLIGIFDDFQAALPLPTRILIKISSVMQKGWPWIILAVVILVFLARKYKLGLGNKVVDSIKMRVPILGDLVLKQGIARFTHTLALLLHSGTPIYQSLQIAIPTLENKVFIKQLEGLHKDVVSGMTLANSLKKVAFMPPFIIQMISVGEEGGRLEDVLLEINAVYTQESETLLKIITSLIEPLVILCLGLILGLIIMGMLLPIFQINMLVH